MEMGELSIEIHVGQSVAVVGEEDLLALDEIANRHQPLADVAQLSRVHERDASSR